MAIGDIKAGRAFVEIGTDDSNLNRGLANAQAKVMNFGTEIKNVSVGMAALGVAAVAAGYKVAQFLVTNLTAAVERASQLVDTADQLGISLESLQNLQFIGSRVGVESEQVSKAIGVMQKNLGKGKIAEDLASIGLELEKIKQLSSDEAFMEIADSLRLVSNENDRAALTTKIFGKSGIELNNIIKLGGEQMRQMAEEGKALGSVMSDDVARGLENAGDAMGDAATAWNNFWNHSGIQDWFVAVADLSSETLTLGEAMTQTMNGTQLALDRANAEIRQAQKDRQNAIVVEEAQAKARAKASEKEKAAAAVKEAAAKKEREKLELQKRDIALKKELTKRTEVLRKAEERRQHLREEMRKRAQQLYAATRTPEETATSDRAEAFSLHRQGLISSQTLMRRLTQIAQSLPQRMQAAGIGSAAGTFNPLAVRGLGDNDELTKAAQETSKNTKKIADRMGQGMVFH